MLSVDDWYAIGMELLTDINPGSLRAQVGDKYAAPVDIDASRILEDLLRYVSFCDVGNNL